MKYFENQNESKYNALATSVGTGDGAYSAPGSKEAWTATQSAGHRAFVEEIRGFSPRKELAMVGEKAWLSWAREWRWWRRTSLCERVGHCATTPLVFLPLPGDVRVAVHTPLITLFGGGINGGNSSAHVLLEWGDWMEAENAFVRHCLTAESFAIDIGANHGVFCLPMAHIARHGSVWAFEPASTTADLLETSRNANQLHNLVVCR